MKKSRKLFYSLISAAVIAILAGGIVYATSLSDRGKEIGKQSADIEKNGSDMIVVGGRGLGLVERFRMGSVSQAVMGAAKCTVIVVK